MLENRPRVSSVKTAAAAVFAAAGAAVWLRSWAISPKTYLCASRAAAMREIEKSVADEIKRKGIENNREAKASLCQRVLDLYECQDGVKDEYLGAKIYKARKLASKFSSGSAVARS